MALSESQISVYNFQSMKSPVELKPYLTIFLLYDLVCYITWLDATVEDLQTRPLGKILLFLRNISLMV